jgi:hypothetical protein
MYRAAIKKMVAFGLILSILLISIIPITGECVAADVDRLNDLYYKRQIFEEHNETSAKIISAKQTPERSDFVVFTIDTNVNDDKSLGVAVVYGDGNTSDDLMPSTVIGMAPYCLVEFIDNGDGRFMLGSWDEVDGDDVISVLPLHSYLDDHNDFYEQTGESDESMTWLPKPGYNNITHMRVIGPQDSTEIHLSAKSTDGIFELKAHIFNTIIHTEERILSPYEMKLDFVIRDFPYKSEDSILGLCSIVVSLNANWKIGLPEAYDDWRSDVEEDGLYYDMGNISEGVGYFTWNKNASLDDAVTEVNHSIPTQVTTLLYSDDRATFFDLKNVALTYGRAGSIVHDPKLGYLFEDLSMLLIGLVRGNIGQFFLSIFLFVGMTVGTVWYRKRSSIPKRVASRSRLSSS